MAIVVVFPRPVAAQERRGDAAAHPEADPVDRHDLAEPLGQAVDGDHRPIVDPAPGSRGWRSGRGWASGRGMAPTMAPPTRPGQGGVAAGRPW